MTTSHNPLYLEDKIVVFPMWRHKDKILANWYFPSLIGNGITESKVGYREVYRLVSKRLLHICLQNSDTNSTSLLANAKLWYLNFSLSKILEIPLRYWPSKMLSKIKIIFFLFSKILPHPAIMQGPIYWNSTQKIHHLMSQPEIAKTRKWKSFWRPCSWF